MKANSIPCITACKNTLPRQKCWEHLAPLEKVCDLLWHTLHLSECVLMQSASAGCNWSETNLTYKSVQLPSEPPLVDASVQLKEFGDGPHREDALKETLEWRRQNMNITSARLQMKIRPEIWLTTHNLDAYSSILYHKLHFSHIVLCGNTNMWEFTPFACINKSL